MHLRRLSLNRASTLYCDTTTKLEHYQGPDENNVVDLSYRLQHNLASPASSAHMEPHSTADALSQEDLGPTIAKRASQCIDLFKEYMSTPGIVTDPTLIEDQLAYLTMWTDELGVFKPRDVSFDYTLRHNPTLLATIRRLLDDIYDSLRSLKPVNDTPHSLSRENQRIPAIGNAEVTKRHDDDSRNIGSDEDQAQKNDSLITCTIGGKVKQLNHLRRDIWRSAPDLWTWKTLITQMDDMPNAPGDTWECRAPSHSLIVFEQEAEYQKHVREEHNVPEERIEMMSRMARRPSRNVTDSLIRIVGYRQALNMPGDNMSE